MGVKLMVEVMDRSPETLTPRERYVLVVLAENARDATRICLPGVEDDPAFIRRSRLVSRSQRYAVIQSLVAKQVLERARRGQKGIRAEYRIAVLAGVQGPGNQDAEDASPMTAQGPGNAETEAAQGPGNQDAEKRDPELQGPGNASSGSRFSAFRVPESGTPYPHTPQPPQGGVGGTPPPPPTPVVSAGRIQQPSLIPVAALRLPEAVQTIYDWGRWNAYSDTTPDEAREVYAVFRRQYGSKPIGYLRAMASADGGGFNAQYREVREQRATRAEAAIALLEQTEPECEHGTRGGQAVHPVTGAPLCPLCRSGRVAAPEGGPGTPRPVATVVDAYRTAYMARLGAAPRSSLLVDITQQAAALLGSGADQQLLTDLARRAGASGEGLVTVATRGEPL